jgi:hypothetical protein
VRFYPTGSFLFAPSSSNWQRHSFRGEERRGEERRGEKRRGEERIGEERRGEEIPSFQLL